MKASVNRTAFTLVEVLIVVVIMAILAAAIVPQFSDSTKDAKSSTTVFNLSTLRAQVQTYRAQHSGTSPTGTLVELTKSTDATGAQGTGAAYPYGPYIREIPANPITNSKVVKVITNDPPVSGDLTSGGGGWLYNVTSGGVWIDHVDHYTK